MQQSTNIRTALFKIANNTSSVRQLFAIITIAAMSLLAHTPSYADLIAQGEWIDKKYSVNGGWEVVTENDQTIIRFDSSFKTKGGPDLKLFLSKQSIEEVTGKTATRDAVLVAPLQSNSGAQEYALPAGINIDDYQSVLIHCEAFSVLWGGGQL